MGVRYQLKGAMRPSFYLVILAALVVSLVPTAVFAEGPGLELVSVSATGEEGDRDTSAKVQVSDSGRYVAFMSNSTNLGQPNGGMGIYVRDRLNQETVSASIDPQGQWVGNVGEHYALSGDGRHLAFTKLGVLYVRDLAAGSTAALASGAVSVSLSADGTVVAYSTSVFPASIIVHNLQSGSVQTLPFAGRTPLVSGDGGRVVYENSSLRILSHDLLTGLSSVVSTGVTSVNYMEPEGVSYNGQYVAFRTPGGCTPANWCVYRRDMSQSKAVKINTDDMASSMSIVDAAISADGTKVAFGYYGPGVGDQVAVHDSSQGINKIATVNESGEPANSGLYSNDSVSLSYDGSVVGFATLASNFLTTGETFQAYVAMMDWVFDTTPPAVTYAISGTTPNDAGWYRQPVTIDWSVIENESDIVSTEGCGAVLHQVDSAGTVYTCSAESVGGTEVASATIKYDASAPVLGNPTWSRNPLPRGEATRLQVSASDAVSGLMSVSYKVDGSNYTPMTYDATTQMWFADFGSDLGVNTYNVSVIAEDAAGNVSEEKTDVLVVYNETGDYITGHARMLPSVNDVLPVPIDGSNQPAKLVIGFTYTPGQAGSSFDASYVVKNNQNEFSLSSKSITWTLIPDANHVSVLGIADLSVYVDGVETITPGVQVRFDFTFDESGSLSSTVVNVYAPDANPFSSQPLYHTTSQSVVNGSRILVHSLLL